MSDAIRMKRWAPGHYIDWLCRQNHDSRLGRRHAQQMSVKTQRLDVTPAVGAAWFPLVRASRNADQIPGVLVRVAINDGGMPAPRALTRQVGDWIAALVGRTELQGLSAMHFGFHNLPPDWEVEGESMGIACAAALLSKLLNCAPHQPVVASGRLQQAPEPVVVGVGHRSVKREICALEAPEAEAYIATTPQSPEELLVRWFGTQWRAQLFMVLNVSSSALSLQALRHYEGRDYDSALVSADAARETVEGDARATACWIAGACRLHRAETEVALALLTEAHQHFTTTEDLEGNRHLHLVQELDAFLGVALLDALQPVAARALLEEALERMEDCPSVWRKARWRSVSLQVAGSLRRALLNLGELEQALAIHDKWQMGIAKVEAEHARSLLERSGLLERLGRLEESQEEITKAQEALVDCPDSHRPTTARFIRLQQVRLGLVEPVSAQETMNWKDWPQPMEQLERLLNDASFPDRIAELMPLPMLRERPIYALAFSGIAARAAQRYPANRWSAEVAQVLLNHHGGREQTTRAMGEAAASALEALSEGRGELWARMAPY